VYGCFYNAADAGTCTGVTNIATVGSVNAGNARWGQADMAGNIFEWVQDAHDDYPAICTNCADLQTDSGVRVIRGGGFRNSASILPAAYRVFSEAADRNPARGARCARPPTP
jgi:formylglycine-generating enzyme required for sulfatase activity